jgi:hypothetical protein
MPEIWGFFDFSAMCKRLGISLEEMFDIVRGVLECGAEALEGIPYWLSAGTALGFYRDGNFIADDSDIDLGVKDDIPIERIENAMLNAGFSANRFRNSKGIPRQRAFIKDGIPIDISIYSLEGDFYTFQTPYGVIKKPKHLLEDLHTIEFHGRTYPIPNPEEYLTWRYGDWRTPKDSKGVYDETINA